jgi:chromosome segregation ATPase
VSKILVVLILVISTVNTWAETEVYQDTINKGMSKGERFEVLESYLTTLSKSVSGLESKLNENSEKMKSLEKLLMILKEEQNKLAMKKVGEDKPSETDKKSDPELSKLKTELEALKSKDIEKLKDDIDALTSTVKSIQLIMKSQKF